MLACLDGGRASLRPAACRVEPLKGEDDRRGFIERLREAKSAARLPARANVVLWQRRDGLGESDVHLDPALAPLVAAGFEIAEVLSPADALARALAAAGVDTSRAAVAAVALHSRGGTIAIVSGGAAITSRAFEWPLGSPSSRSGSELLDRYVTVSQLGPILRHFIELTRPVYGVEAASVCLCGSLPELRSLSMLLIEEIDLEVETLDSVQHFDLAVPDTAGSAAAFQLAAAACAAARPRQAGPQADVQAPPRTSQAVTTLGAVMLALLWSSLQLAGSSPAQPFPAVAAMTMAAGQDASHVTPRLQPEATMGHVSAAVDTPAVAEPEPAIVGTASPPPRRRAARPLSSPLPAVDGVMIFGERRMAIVEGVAVAPGDAVGDRIVHGIDREGVVLREPSGLEVRVAIRTRKSAAAGTSIKPQP